MIKTYDDFLRAEGERLKKGGLASEKTLRDYFAAKAMQSICSVLHQGIRPADIAAMVRDAYVIADAMLKERAK